MEFRKFTHNFSLMASAIEIKIYSNIGTIETNEAIQQAKSEFHRINKTYTRFNQESELSKLNKHFEKNITTYPISEEFLKLVSEQIKVAKITAGKFDPTIIDLLELHGYKNSFDKSEISKLREKNRKNLTPIALNKYLETRPSWKEIIINDEEKSIKLAKNQRLDFGSIGKGWAVDLAAKKLQKNGISNFLISAGGDIYGHGLNHETNSTWKVDLVLKQEKFKNPQIIGQVEIPESGAAVASSGSWSRATDDFNHLIDTESGQGNNQSLQVFCYADSAWKADLYATAAFVTGKDSINTLSKENVEILLITSKNEIYQSDLFPNFIR